MELISKEVVRRIIDSGRTREQMLGMVECAVTFEECEDCISRDAVLEILGNYGCTNKEGLLFRDIKELPSVKPKVDVDALINKIETELSWSMYDDWGNSTSLHDGLLDIIREWAGRSGEE